jgi:hypothetical protein
MTFPQVKQGEPFNPSARFQNATADVVNAYRRGEFSGHHLTAIGNQQRVVVRAVLPILVDAGHAIRISGLFQNDETENDTLDPVLTLANPYTDADADGQIAITLQGGIVDDTIPVVVYGLAPAKIAFGESNRDSSFAKWPDDAGDDESPPKLAPTYLPTAIRILWANPDNDGLSLVLIGHPISACVLMTDADGVSARANLQLGDGLAEVYRLKLDGTLEATGETTKVWNMSRSAVQGSAYIQTIPISELPVVNAEDCSEE